MLDTQCASGQLLGERQSPMKTKYLKRSAVVVATAAVATLTGAGVHAVAGPPDDADPATRTRCPWSSFDRGEQVDRGRAAHDR